MSSKIIQIRSVEAAVARRLKALAASRGEKISETLKWLVSLAPAQAGEGR